MVQDNLAEDVANICGYRFSKVRIARDYAHGGLVVAAGSHDEPVNTVGVWDTEVVSGYPDWLLEHHGCKVDGSVTCLEFAKGNSNASGMLLWAGTSAGSLELLRAQADPRVAEEEVNDDGSPSSYNHWTVSSQAYVSSGAGDDGRTPLHSGAVSAVAVHSGADAAITAGEDGIIRQVQVTPTGAVNASKWGQDVADWVALYDVKYASSNPSYFFTAGAASGLRMWDLRSPAAGKCFGGGSCFVSLEPVETFLLAGGEAGEICIFDTRSDRGPLYTHSPATGVGGAFHSAEVWTIRACGGDAQLFLSCCADGTVMSSVPELDRNVRMQPVGYHRYSQAVNDVDAFVVDPGLKTESTLIMCAADSGLLLGEKSTFGGMMQMVE